MQRTHTPRTLRQKQRNANTTVRIVIKWMKRGKGQRKASDMIYNAHGKEYSQISRDSENHQM